MPEAKLEIIVPLNKAKERLDKFLAHEVEGLSRSRLQKLIEEEKITVNGKPTKAHHPVHPNERIEIIIPTPVRLELLPEDIPLDIVYEDENLIVVNKEAGMVVHPAFGNYEGTLVNALLFHCKHLSGIGGVQRQGIVHRLDKGTSGLIVVAKDDLTHQDLATQFASRQIEREYWAVVWGHFKKTTGRIETQLARSLKDRTRMTVHSRGKPAVTNYQVLQQYPLLSLVKLNLETGRTHQIRVHLSYIGHPVFGDETYGGRNRRLGGLNTRERQLATKLLTLMPRQALHAKTLGFWHPVKKEFLRFDSELPPDMKTLLEELKTATV
ncbi:MAG: RluA family pseudouridine synthase [candidate division KSB1 bacterium]|nr:RluA family pseudouridine synthase [candidate division KSB1 bacterium]